MVQLGVGYAAEDIDPDNDPGGILRDTIVRENAVAISNRSLAARHKLAIYTLIWDTVSRESQEAVLSRAADQPLGPGDYERLQTRNDPLLLLQYIRSTHLLPATEATFVDQQAARAAFHSMRQRGAETLHEYKAKFQDAVRAMELHGLSAPEQAEQATHCALTTG